MIIFKIDDHTYHLKTFLLNTLSDIYGEVKVKNIIHNKFYDDKTLCIILPYINKKSSKRDEDLEKEAKLYILSEYTDFFFKFGLIVDRVPDLRSISETTREKIQVELWNPWIELERELDILYTEKERGDEKDEKIYHILDVNEEWTTADEKNFLPFFCTYPIVSYLLFLNEENISLAVEFDYPNIHLLPFPIPLDEIINSKSKRMVEWILRDTSSSVLLDKAKINERILDNIFILEWLINKGTSDKIPVDHLIKVITREDHIGLFYKTYDQKYMVKWSIASVHNKSEKILLHLLNNDDVFSMVKGSILTNEFNPVFTKFLMSILSKKYGIQRYYDNGDMLKIAIDIKFIDWIKSLPLEELASPIINHYNGEEIHPILYVFRNNYYLSELYDIIPYLLSIYEETLEDILYYAVMSHDLDAIKTMVSYNFSNDIIVKAISLIHADASHHKNNRKMLSSLVSGISAANPEDIPLMNVTLKNK